VRSSRNSVLIDTTWQYLPPAPDRLSIAAADREYLRIPITAPLPSNQPILANALMSRNLKTRRSIVVSSDDVSRAKTRHNVSILLAHGIIAREAKHSSAGLKTRSGCELCPLPPRTVAARIESSKQ
jgi:hypothetical protein